MNVLADTSLVPPADRYSYWADMAPRALMHPVGVKLLTEHGGISGRIVEYQLGPVRAYRMQGPASLVTLRAGSIAHHDPERFSVALILRGRQQVLQEQRSASLDAGDLVAVHTSKPYAIRFDSPYDVAVFVIDRVILRPYTERMCTQTAMRLTSGFGAGRVVAAQFRALADELDRGNVNAEDVDLGESVVDAVRALFAGSNASPDGESTRRRDLPTRVRAYIDANLADSALTPSQIAHEHFISIRYLYKLFEDEGGVSTLIRRKRLERCRRDLVDPALSNETVASIGRRWGFQDPGYFSRLFRECYEIAPTQFRREYETRRELTHAVG